MAITKFDLCNRALLRVGGNFITAFDASTVEAVAAEQEYDGAVDYLLSLHRWRFASQQFSPTRLTATPTDEYDYYWQVPAATITVHAAKRAGKPVKFDRYEDKLACNVDDGLVIDHTIRVSEDKFPPHFQMLVVDWLQAVFEGNVRRDKVAAREKMKYVEDVSIPRAKNIDSQQQTSRKFTTTPRLIAIRGR